MVTKGNWATHPKIEQALYVHRIENGIAWLSGPSPDGWAFPVTFALPVRELTRCPKPTRLTPPDDFLEAPF